jgi:copper chaperone NosL
MPALTFTKIELTGFGIYREIKAMTPCRTVRLLRAGVFLLALAACKEDAERPAAHTMTDAAIGHYCGMMLTEHQGPKGQILLEGADEPVWFTSVRDTLAFTLLPEEPKDIAAIYVSDMGGAPSWAAPGPDNWTDAKAASFVINSSAEGGMGGAEAVPFADKAKAEAFAAEHGGEVVAFDAIPPDYILTAATTPPAEPPAPAPEGDRDGH